MPVVSRPVFGPRQVVLVALLVACVLVVLAPAGAGAAVTPVSTGAVANGAVNAVVNDAAGRTYIGGDFTMVGPRLGGAIVLGTASDQPAAGFPDVNGPVLAAAGDGAGGWFIGGSFTAVGGVARSRLAHLLPDRTLDPAWNPGANNVVRALLRTGGALYAGGDFTTVGGLPSARLGKLSTSGTGAADSAFFPGLGGGGTAGVYALALAGSSIIAGGSFTGAQDQLRNGLVKVDAATGAPDAAWDPVGFGPAAKISAIARRDDGTLFLGGAFFSVGGKTRVSLAKINPSGTVDDDWNPGAGGPVNALALSGQDLFVGGQFFGLGTPPASISNLAKLSTEGSGAVQAGWDPTAGGEVFALSVVGGDLYAAGAFTAVGGQSRSGLARLSTTGTGAADGWNPNPNGPARSVTVDGSSILAGGDFTSAGSANVRRPALARLLANGSLDPSWTPNVTDAVRAIALSGTALYVGGTFGPLAPGLGPYLAKVSTTDAGAVDPDFKPVSDTPVTALATSGDSVYFGKMISSDAVIKVAAGSGAKDAGFVPDAQGFVNALAVSGSSLYIGGNLIGGFNGAARAGFAKVALSDGALDPWNPGGGGLTGEVKTLLVSGDALYAGGSFSGPVGGSFAQRLAKLALGGTGAADPAFAATANRTVSALAVSGPDLYVGGDFSTIGNAAHAKLAKLSAATGAPDEAFAPAFSTAAGPAVLGLAATPSRVIAGGGFAAVGTTSATNIAIFDTTVPSLSLTVPSEGARYRQGQVVPAAYTCSDPDGAADSVACTGTVGAGSPIDTSTAGTKTFTATATDAGANTDSRTVSYTVDASAPTISIGALPGGASYAVGEQVPVTYTCADADGGQDIATCAGPVPTGGSLDTSTSGPRTFTVTATDLVGNTTSSSVSYSVRAAAAPVVKDTTKPSLTALTFSPAAFRAEKSGAPTGKASKKQLKAGTKVSFKLSEAATVTFTVVVPRKGKVKARTLGRFTVKAAKGATAFVFRGRIGGKTLKPGDYQVTAEAKDAAGLKSVLLRRTIKIKR